MRIRETMTFLRSNDEWVAFAFSAILGAITLVPIVASGNDSGRILPYLCFLPMAFFYVGASIAQTRSRIKALEARIRDLERARGGG